jgi:FkbM family methyltransferase
MKNLIRSLFAFFNLEIRKKEKAIVREHYNNEMGRGLERLEKLKLKIKTIVDVGAAEGLWTNSAKYFWPDADFILFEPLEERREILESLAKKDKSIHVVHFAAGKEKTTINFMVTEDLDGSGVTDGKLGNSRVVQVTSIPEEINRLELKGPFLIKLDTHGFEIPILEGCFSLLDEISVFIIECYGFRIAKNSLLAYEMCQYLDTIGFRLFDIVDTMRRPGDNAFWQADAFFIRKDHPVFDKNSYA